MTLGLWAAGFGLAWAVRRGIRWHLGRWVLRALPRRPRPPRRPLIDPLTTIIPARRLFT